MKNELAELVARYHKIADIIAEDEEHGLTCPNLDCYSCPLYFDEHTKGICLYTLENKVWKTIKELEEMI